MSSKNLGDFSSYYSLGSYVEETKDTDELSHEEQVYIDKKRSKSWNKNKRRAAYRQNKPEGWYMDYFRRSTDAETPRFNRPHADQ